MNRNHIHPVTLVTCFAAFVLMLTTSCSTSKNLNYFNDLPNAETYELKAMPVQERIIERGDKIDIAFITKDQESAAFFNKHSMGVVGAAAGAVAGTGAAGPGTTDYLVDAEGEVEIPVVGRVKLAGLTALQAKQKLMGLVSPYLKEPLVEVSFITFKITVLGEVKNPGSYVMSAQHATLFDALAAAGDLPHSAKRFDVRLYRDYNGKRTISQFDLRKSSVLEDPEIFLMKPNDVIYIKPRSNSLFKEESGVFLSVFSILLTAMTLGFTIKNSTK